MAFSLSHRNVGLKAITLVIHRTKQIRRVFHNQNDSNARLGVRKAAVGESAADQGYAWSVVVELAEAAIAAHVDALVTGNLARHPYYGRSLAGDRCRASISIVVGG